MPVDTGTSFPELPDFGNLQRGNFSYVPVVPGRLEFAIEVRRRILADRPQVVAVELPENLEGAYRKALKRLPSISVIFYGDALSRVGAFHDQDDDFDGAIYVPVEPTDPFVEAIRTALEIGAEVVFADPDSTERPHIPGTYPDTYALSAITAAQYVEAYRLQPQARSREIETFGEGVAWKLQGSDPFARVMVVLSLNMLDAVLDAMEMPQSEPARRRRQDLRLVNPHPDCLGEITSEYPFLQERYEAWRSGADPAPLDRRRVQSELFQEAGVSYHLNTGETLQLWQRRLLTRYSRSLATVNGDLAPQLHEIVIAARSIVDENFAWDVWETASKYGAQDTTGPLDTVHISGDEVWLNTRRIRLRRRLPSMKRRMTIPGLKPRKKEKKPGEWAPNSNGASICSFPPEDLVIENFGRYLKKKGKGMLSEERATVEPFTSSMLDGIDLRETMRNWHEGPKHGKKIFVRNAQKIHGDVGSVIVIFDDDRDGRYTYQTTWLGEHQNESDMAFYSTAPFSQMVGPGIGRAEYGGFLMSLPARRMYDIWADPDYDFAESKAERLLLAGLDYSVKKYVVYAAANPPRSVFRNIAAQFGRTIVYIPIGQLSPVTMKKIRVVHILDGYEKRDGAKEFIW